MQTASKHSLVHYTNRVGEPGTCVLLWLWYSVYPLCILLYSPFTPLTALMHLFSIRGHHLHTCIPQQSSPIESVFVIDLLNIEFDVISSSGSLLSPSLTQISVQQVLNEWIWLVFEFTLYAFEYFFNSWYYYLFQVCYNPKLPSFLKVRTEVWIIFDNDLIKLSVFVIVAKSIFGRLNIW